MKHKTILNIQKWVSIGLVSLFLFSIVSVHAEITKETERQIMKTLEGGKFQKTSQIIQGVDVLEEGDTDFLLNITLKITAKIWEADRWLVSAKQKKQWPDKYKGYHQLNQREKQVLQFDKSGQYDGMKKVQTSLFNQISRMNGDQAVDIIEQLTKQDNFASVIVLAETKLIGNALSANSTASGEGGNQVLQKIRKGITRSKRQLEPALQKAKKQFNNSKSGMAVLSHDKKKRVYKTKKMMMETYQKILNQFSS